MFRRPAPARLAAPSPRRATRVRLGASALLGALALGAPPAVADAQRRPPMEFTRQVLFILDFQRGEGADAKLGRRVGDEMREAAEKALENRELDVVGGSVARLKLQTAGFVGDEFAAAPVLETAARFSRADEYLVGRVDRTPAGLRLQAELRLVRDRGTRQPLPAVTAPDIGAATAQLARHVAQARAQMPHLRRCENALRDGRNAVGLAAARAGVAADPRAAFVRTCFLNALALAGSTPAERLAQAQELLAIDSTSKQALYHAARVYDAVKQRREAETMWLRLAETDTNDLEQIARVTYALVEGGSAAAAEPLIVRAVRWNSTSLEMLRLKWLVTHEARHWALAAESGEALLAADSAAGADSSFILKLANAHQGSGAPLRAMELAARGVQRFPKDARLYALYTQFVKSETDTVLPRGLALFPKSATLLALQARELRAKGQAEAALEATRMAVGLDSTLPQGLLSLAQAEFDLGRPDSALVTLERAVGRGEDTATVAQFALAKGNALYRAANATRQRADFERALGFFALSDRVRPTPQSSFLRGTAALSAARAALAEAAGAPPRDAAACALSRRGSEMLKTARAGLTAGEAVAPDVAKQYGGFVDQLQPVAEKQLAILCVADGVPAADAGAKAIP